MTASPSPEAPAAPATTVWWASRRPLEELDRSSLSAQELGRIDRLRGDASRERSALARILVRVALAERLGIAPREVPLDWTAGPRLTRAATGPWLSLSHSAERVAVAVSDAGPIGLDIEAASRAETLRPGTVERACSERERHDLAALSADERPLVALGLWTAKEAVLKATRHGLTVAPEGVEFDAVVDPRSLVRFDPRPELVRSCWVARLGGDPDYVGSVAVLSAERGSVQERSGDALLQAAA